MCGLCIFIRYARLWLLSHLDVINLLSMTHLVFYVFCNVQVLTCRSGSALMLALIYSEILKTVRIYGLLDFDAEIFFPTDLNSLPRGFDKQKSKLGDEPHIMTSKSFLVEVSLFLPSIFIFFNCIEFLSSISILVVRNKC